MTAPTPAEVEIAEVLAAHDVAITALRPGRRPGINEWFAECVCGAEMPWDMRERATAHRAHVAEQIAATLADRAEQILAALKTLRVDHRHPDEKGAASPFGKDGRAYYYAGDVIDVIYDFDPDPHRPRDRADRQEQP